MEIAIQEHLGAVHDLASNSSVQIPSANPQDELSLGVFHFISLCLSSSDLVFCKAGNFAALFKSGVLGTLVV